jgi:3'-5' exonuclease
MLDSINPKQILFVDIETVPQYFDFESIPDELKKHWEKKSSYFREENQTASDVYQRAGIYAEFGKIICISVGALTGDKEKYGLKLKSFYGNDESKLLKEFAEMIEKSGKEKNILLCAHNGKEFDYPYISRRMLINSISLPKIFDNSGKKPWEINHLDTLELWKFGDYKHYTSLDLLAAVFNIPSPKTEVDGSMVADIYYKEKNMEKIVKYCENDVIALAQLMMRFLNHTLISQENIAVTVY